MVVIVGWGTILGVVSGVVDALALAQGESLDGVRGFVGVLVGSAVALPSAFAAGFLATALTAMLVLPAVGGTIRLLGEPPPRDAVGAFCGATVAFMVTLPIGLSMAHNGIFGDPSRATIIWLHLVVALAMGQVAGLLAAAPDTRRRRAGRLKAPVFRLSLWRILAAMIPLSLSLSLLRAADLLTVPMAMSILAGLATGWLIRRPVAWGVNRWLDRRVRVRRARLAERST